MNKVILIGRLTKDPELRKTDKGNSFVNFQLAVSRNYKNQQGDVETDFINCLVWGTQADNLARYMRKGSQIAVEGSIQINTANVNGKTEYYTKVLVNLIEYLSKAENNNNAPAVSPYEFNQEPNANSGGVGITDEDIPFQEGYMEIITFFEKLDKNILILTQEVKLFQIKLDFIIDASAPQMPKDIIFGEAKGNNFFTAEELYNEVINLKTTINLLLKALEELKVMKDIIEKNLKDFIKTSNDLEYLIIKNHYIEKKSLKKIAQDLGYSYQYIRKTHMEIKKKLGK